MKIKQPLLPRQEEAVEKLRHIKIGALYMEMGTGKTITALSLIARRMNAGKVDRVLWLCPCSIKGDIAASIAKHSDLAVPQLTICGIETLSSSVRENSRLLEMVKDGKTFLVVDESSLVKNPFALRSINITRIASACPYKLILNGTPISRNMADLFSQWYLLDWRILGYRSYYTFEANHVEYDPNRPGRIRRILHPDYLAEKIAPYTYECRQSDCFTLPEKRRAESKFQLTSRQYEHYNEIADALLLMLDERRPETIYRLFSALQSITAGYRITLHGDTSSRETMFPDPTENPRMQELAEVIEKSNEQQIIFARNVDDIKNIVAYLNGIKPESAVPFYGEVPQKKRQEAIEKFRAGAQFLVANKACGAFGLNLQFCHRLIYYDNDWDWGTRSQSEDRVYRYGQTQDVEIVDIIAANTIDVTILDCLMRKESLSDRFKSELHTANGKKKLKDLIGGKCYGKDLPKQERV